MTRAARPSRWTAKPRPRRGLWGLSILTQPEAEEAVAAAMSNLLGETASSYTDVEMQQTRVTVFLEQKPKPGIRASLLDQLQGIRQCGLRVQPGTISIRKVRLEDWAESWKRHFRAIEIGGALLLKPSWIRRKPRRGQAVVVLDPGLSFGTGQHPTTAFCLEQLVAHRPAEGERRSMLDIGTGSGVLAIAAAKLGYAPVEAFDFDSESLRAARENIRANEVSRRVRLFRGDLTRLPLAPETSCDVVCANLISTLLIGEAGRIVNRVREGGVVIAAGILAVEFKSVQRAFEQRGLRLIATWKRNEWRSGVFRRGETRKRARNDSGGAGGADSH